MTLLCIVVSVWLGAIIVVSVAESIWAKVLD